LNLYLLKNVINQPPVGKIGIITWLRMTFYSKKPTAGKSVDYWQLESYF
jgi:hypothetical protein